MLTVSSDTTLFGDFPQEPIERVDNNKEKYSKKYKLVPKVVEVKENKDTNKKQKQKSEPQKAKINPNDRPTEHKAILKGTHGHKLFAMLNSIKITPKAPQPEIENVEPKGNVAKRKLTMSK